MPTLVTPDVAVHASFLAAMAEFVAEGRGTPSDHTMVGAEIREFGARWSNPRDFTEYVHWLRDQAFEESPRPAHHVPSTTLWWVDGTRYLGRIAIRHRLTPSLREIGGHIGYDVRPSARRQGHASAMLRAGLPIAYDKGIDPALVTCSVDNIGSRLVIERNGGIVEDQRAGILRYWVPTGRTSPSLR
jgi:predicted acetyltransferase